MAGLSPNRGAFGRSRYCNAMDWHRFSPLLKTGGWDQIRSLEHDLRTNASRLSREKREPRQARSVCAGMMLKQRDEIMARFNPIG